MATDYRFGYSKERIERNIKKIEKLVSKELAVVQKREIENAFKETIDEYYSNYEPTVYGRNNHGLYDILVFANMDGGTFVGFEMDNIDYDQTRMGSIENLSGFKEYLYDITFLQGYHGGADKISDDKIERYGAHPSPGKPWYRTPVGYYTKWGKESPKDQVPPVQLFKDRVRGKQDYFKQVAAESFAKHAIDHLLD